MIKQGWRHGFESGGGAILRAKKNFFDPPHFLASGGVCHFLRILVRVDLRGL